MPPSFPVQSRGSHVVPTTATAPTRHPRSSALRLRPADKPYIVEELTPGLQVQTDEEMLAAFRRYGQTAFHVAGTCRMGIDVNAVLDPELRVRGVDGLRVIDTSIMPSLVSGNTNAPAMAIAMRAAEIITGIGQQGEDAA